MLQIDQAYVYAVTFSYRERFDSKTQLCSGQLQKNISRTTQHKVMTGIVYNNECIAIYTVLTVNLFKITTNCDAIVVVITKPPQVKET